VKSPIVCLLLPISHKAALDRNRRNTASQEVHGSSQYTRKYKDGRRSLTAERTVTDWMDEGQPINEANQPSRLDSIAVYIQRLHTAMQFS